jgi:hypothetical protein
MKINACRRIGSLLWIQAVICAVYGLCWSACGQQSVDSFLGVAAWQPYTNNPILSPSASTNAWDAAALETMTVVKVGNIWHMYYEGWAANDEGSVTSLPLGPIAIGHATSLDGVNWTKDPANPVLPASPNDWDANGAWDPSLIYEDGLFKLWHGGNAGDFGYATSTDGTHFVEHGQLSHLGACEDDHVVHDPASGHYFMYYWNRQYEPEGLYCAISPDETNFDFAGATPIHIQGLPYTNTMYKFPNVFKYGSQWFMYFGEFIRPGCAGCWTGYATSQDGLNWQLQNPQMIQCHDAFVLPMTNNLYIMYYGPDGLFDQPADDIRLAFYNVIPCVVITNQPQDSVVYAGGTATFTTGAVLVGTNSVLNYQWQTNGVNIAGATNAAYTTPALTQGSSGTHFNCVVSATGVTNVMTRTALLWVAPPGTSYAQSVEADNPVVYYRFEEGVGATVAVDSSGAGNNGTYNNVSLGNVSAMAALGRAAGFNGSSSSLVAVPALAAAPSLGGNGNSQVTIESWIQPQKLSGAEAIYAVNTWANGVVHFLVNGSSIRFTVGNSVNADSSEDDANFPSSPAIGIGTWAYVAVVYNGATPSAVLYINGQPVSTNFYSATYPIALNAGAIGVQTDGGDPPFTGLIDEFAIYTNALSAARIQEHYAAALAGGPSAYVVISSEPQDALGYAGVTATFTTGATLVGTNSALSYQWQTNGVSIAGATNAAYTTPTLTLANNGTHFDCVVTAAGAIPATTRNALLTVSVTNYYYADSVLADHPVVYYRFEEGDGATVAVDSSGEGKNGVYTNVSLGNPGAAAALGRAAGFKGSSSSLVAVPALGAAPSLGGSGNNQVTIEAWIEPQQLSGAEAIYAVNIWANGVVHFLVNGSSIRFTVGNSVNADGSPDDANFPSSPDIGIGTWAYAAVVYNGATPSAVLYINGQPVSTNFYSATYPIALNAGAIGVQTDGGDPPFSGLIDEFAIYTNALSAARIQEHYAAASMVPPPMLSMEQSGNMAAISWDLAGFVLQDTTNLLNNKIWVDVLGASNSPVTVPITNISMFYRLRSQ